MKYNQKEIPHNAISGDICPFRDDYFQAECWRCDLCGRNEDAEHGVLFDRVKLQNKYALFIDDINSVKINGREIEFDYGFKKISTSIEEI